MNTKKICSKGYTITVKSWENDLDYAQTLSIVVDSKEEAKAYFDLMQLCESKHNQPKGVIKMGNSVDNFSDAQIETIVEFLESNPILIHPGDKIDFKDPGSITDFFSELTGKLLGYSEFYLCRVMDKCTITYSPEDIYLEEINF